MNEIKKSVKFVQDLMPMAIGEIAVILLVLFGAGALDLIGIYKFDPRVLSGAWLGAVVAILNYAFLTLSVDKAINKYLSLRGDREMSDEEAEKFAAENSVPIQNAIKTSFIIRTFSMLATLLVAFILEWFNPLATAIPLLAFRPLLSITESVKSRKTPPPNPEKFIKYDYENDEKESDE